MGSPLHLKALVRDHSFQIHKMRSTIFTANHFMVHGGRKISAFFNISRNSRHFSKNQGFSSKSTQFFTFSPKIVNGCGTSKFSKLFMHQNTPLNSTPFLGQKSHQFQGHFLHVKFFKIFQNLLTKCTAGTFQ